MFAKNLAVVIGINQYGNGIAPLQTAVEDAKYLGHLLELNHDFQVVTYEDQTASLENLRKLFKDDLPAQITEHHRLLIYFAGHGIAKASYGTEAGASRVEGPAGYLIPQDARPEDEGSFLPMQEMYQALEKLPCQHFLLILDCCFAGAFRWASTRDILVPEKMYRQRFERFQSKAAWQVLTSSAHDQKALDILRDNRSIGNAAAHSPFATALYEALAGEADLIQDQVITATELYLYLRDAVETRSEERQTPGLWPLPKHDRGEFFFLSQDFDEDRLEEAPAPRADRNPYRGLQAYDERHGPLFFGRDRLIKSLYQEHVLKHPLTIVVGASGTGKSSLVKAGLVPYLRKADYLQRRQDFSDTAEQVTEDWHILPILRPGNDSLSALAQMLLPLSPLQLNSEAIDTLESFQALVAAQSVNLPDVFVTLWRELDQQPKGQLTLVLEWAETLKERLTQPDIATTAELQTLQNLVTTAEALVRQLTAHLQQNDALIQSLLDQWLAAAPNTHALLVIDQAEELITQVQNEVSRQCFIRYLEAALAAHPKQLHCILTVRMDFEPMVKQLFTPDWQKQWENQYRQVVPPMTQADLRDAIEGPANEAVLHFEPASLVDDLINEVVQMPGALPLLSFTLSELYVKCVERFQQGDLNRALTQEDYESFGKVSGSLRYRANQEFDALDVVGQRTLRNIMLRMVAFEGGELARRRVPKTELVYTDSAENQRVEEIVTRLVEQRLLISGRTPEGEYVEPAHDALVRGWAKLQNWLAQEKNLTLQRRLSTVAMEWSDRQQASYLWNSSPYLEVLNKDVLQSNENNWLNKVETFFIQQSVRQKRKNVMIRWGVISIALFLLSGTTLLAINSAINARNRLLEAFSNTAKSLFTSNQDIEALLQATEAGELFINTPKLIVKKETEILVINTLREILYGLSEFNRFTDDADFLSVSLGPDGQTFAAGLRDGRIKIWSNGGQQVQTLNEIQNPVDDSPVEISFARDGQILISMSHDQGVEIWQRQLNKGFSLYNSIAQPSVNAFAVSPDSQTIAIANFEENSIKIVGLDGSLIEDFDHNRHAGTINDLSFSPNGHILASASADGVIKVWDLRKNQLIKSFPVNQTIQIILSVQFVDGHTIAVAGEEGGIELWNINGKFQGMFDGSHDDAVSSLAVSSDKSFLASSSKDGTVKLWDIGEKNEIRTFNGHREVVNNVSFSSDNTVLASASNDNTVRLWQLNDRVPKIIGSRLSFSSDGQTIATAKDGYIYLWEPDGTLKHKFPTQLEDINKIKFGENDRVIATVSDGSIQIWNLDGKILTKWKGHEKVITTLSFNPAKNILASGSLDKNIKLWNLQGELLQKIETKSYVTRVLFSPNGKMIASAGGNISSSTASSRGVVQLRTLEGELIESFEGHTEPVLDISFSPDGNILASASEDGTIRFWRMQQSQHNDPPLKPIEADTLHVNRVMFASSGDFVISSGSQDHDLRLWNLDGELLQVLEKHAAKVIDFSFSPDGEMIISADYSGRTILWNLNLGNLLSSSCSLLDGFLDQSDSSSQKNGDRETKICNHD